MADSLTSISVPSTASVSPTVSIGMPVYNGAKFIREALDSLLAQSFADFELIISDNASTDGTQIICENYARQDRRIAYIRQAENLGAVRNFLFVLRQSRGTYFMWAAHDDVWAPNWLESLVKAFRPEDFALRGALHLTWNDGTVVERCPADYRRGQYLRVFMGEETTRNARNAYVYSLFRREQVAALNFAPLLNDVYSWDYLFVFQMIEKGNLRSIPETFQTYRLHETSDGSRVMRQYTTLQRLIFKVHPLSYYAQYVQAAPPLIKPLLVLAAPVKHGINQVQLWWRGFRKIVLGLENL